MLLILVLATLSSGAINGSFFARNFGQRGSVLFSLISMLVALIAAIFCWYEVIFCSSEIFLNLFDDWFTIGSFNVIWQIYLDLTSANLLFTVISVSFAVHCYSIVYMQNEPHLNLFMSYLSLFTFFMVVLVIAQDLIVMLLGWEGNIMM